VRVLVTGADGFLGSATVKAARARGADVIASGRRGGDAPADVSSPEALTRVLDEVAPDAIINCAATVDFSAPLEAIFATNTLGPAVIAAWCFARRRHLVQCSTLAVYGIRAPKIDDATPVTPDTAYGASKLLADEMIAASGCSSTIVRLGGVYGAGGGRHLGLNRSIDLALGGIPPTLKGAGEARRSYVSVDDAADILAWCAQQRLRGPHICAGSEQLPLATMLQLICDVLLPGAKPVREEGPVLADQVAVSSAALPQARSMVENLRAIDARRAHR
jgi:nucleoside-diphosphate-sugar epimerase